MVMMSAELRDIRYFAAVVEHGSLTRAAAQLKVSQPTLTHAIARLEEALGGPLWRRLPNRRAGVLPTELGARVLERGGRALAELDALTQDAAHLRGLRAGELRVGSVQSLAGTLLPRWVARYVERFPDIVLDLPLVTSESAGGLIKQGKIDAALVVGPVPIDRELKRARCGEQELVAVTILPEGAIPSADRGVSQVRFERPQPRRAVHLIWRADVAPSPALRAFVDVGRELSVTQAT